MTARTDATDAQVVTTAVVAVPVTLGTLLDIIETADDGGIDYWTEDTTLDGRGGFLTVQVQADLFGAIPADVHASRVTDRPGRRFIVGPTQLADALTRIAMGRVQLRPDLVTIVREVLLSGETSEVDAEVADVVVQVAAWGSVVFG